MSEKGHNYQGRQSALQVFKDFAGGVGGDPDVDEEDEDEKETGDQNIQNEVCENFIAIVTLTAKAELEK
jgi:hypothetical protein